MIFSSFLNLGYPRHFLDNILRDVRSKFYHPRSPNNESPEERRNPIIRLPYNKFISGSTKTVLKANGIDVVHPATKTIKSKVTRTKFASGGSDGVVGGCYSVPCGDCDARYIGQTGRALSTRIGEHKSNVRFGRNNSAIFKHVQDTGHNINFNNSEMIYRSGALSNRLIVESSLIKNVKNFNNTEGAILVDSLTSSLVLNSNSRLKSKVRSFNPD